MFVCKCVCVFVCLHTSVFACRCGVRVHECVLQVFVGVGVAGHFTGDRAVPVVIVR